MWIMISKDLYGLCLIFTFVSWAAIVSSEKLFCDQEEAVFEFVNKGNIFNTSFHVVVWARLYERSIALSTG